MRSSKPQPTPAATPKPAVSQEAPQPNWEERYQEADIPRRNRQPRRVHRFSFLSFFLTSVACLVCVLLIFSYTRLTVLNDQIATEKNDLLTLQNESVKLNAEYESRYDLSEIELYAQSELGMTKMDKSQVEYVEIGIPDTITRITDEHFSLAMLRDAVAGLINTILSYFS